MKVSIIYDSITKNTESLALAINESIKDLVNVTYCGHIDSYELSPADLYFIGSCTKKMRCSDKILSLLEKLENSNICYFGTASYSYHPDFALTIINNIKPFIPLSSSLKDYFISHGSMKDEAYSHYFEVMTKKLNVDECSAKEHFERIKQHPDASDIDKVCAFALKNIDNMVKK